MKKVKRPKGAKETKNKMYRILIYREAKTFKFLNSWQCET